MKKIYTLFAFLLITEIILALICGPHSCEWGNSVYFYFGIAGLLISFSLPLFQKSWLVKKRIGYSILLPVVLAITWCAGFMLGEFRIICHLI